MLAKSISRATGFRVPDEPLAPWIHALPMLLGSYERKVANEIRRIVKPGMVVVDGGAHVGYITRLLSELVGDDGHVLAFEMNPPTLRLLRKNVRGLRNVKIIPAAIGTKDEMVRMYDSRLSSAASVTRSKPGLRRGRLVEMRSIASVLRQHRLKHPDFIKLDIEGGEPDVIRNLPDWPVSILFEVKRYILKAAGESPETFLTELEQKGFSVMLVNGTLDKANLLAVRKQDRPHEAEQE